MQKKSLFHMILAAMLLVLALVLPIVTGNIPQIGNMLCPMHIPVILCGFFCGPWFGLVIGAAAPILRFLTFGAPILMPSGIAMSVELAAYGCLSGLFYRIFPKKKAFIYLSLGLAMLSGRFLWGAVRAILYGLGKSEFGFSAFIAGAFTNAIPGILLQILLIPILVMTLRKAFPDLIE